MLMSVHSCEEADRKARACAKGMLLMCVHLFMRTCSNVCESGFCVPNACLIESVCGWCVCVWSMCGLTGGWVFGMCVCRDQRAVFVFV